MARDASPDPGRRTRLAVAAVLTAIGLVAASLVIGRVSAPVMSDPIDSSAEAGFARDMQVHHQQAVEMALVIRDATNDPEVRLLAYDIATSQAQQSGQMFGWLADWGLSQAATEPSMTWMSRPPLGASSHDMGGSMPHSPGSAMPGLATREQLTQLSASEGVDAERLFLTLMIAHHEGGVEMAKAIVERSTNRVVLDLANSIVKAQSSEITFMRELLAARR
ncbi:DUF305 domain-containing protein [Salinibacterium sp.]|uniref:DUF305 domain-containing protein n=1 Tax=Salinibacterium sp. TaxID=1915057 RepID=UPI00286BD456|nr:DUF305 domain-containing protein [Salinibacterium sp.]